MFRTQFITNYCNRREFVVKASLLVAGGLVACSGKNEQEAEAPPGNDLSDIAQNQVLAVPNTPTTIRVRIGRVRNINDVAKIGETSIQKNRSGWIIRGDAPHRKPEGGSVDFESLNNCTIHIQGQTKIISGNITTHQREDISSHAFDVVAHVPLEKYVPGVLAGELYTHWHFETFAAQAVAARSYAVAEHLQRIGTSHYDVTDGPSSQMFIGNVELEIAHNATQETKGMILTWNNAVVPAYYSACCGGRPALASDAISGSKQHDIPPLQGHDGTDPCTTLDVHSWTVDRKSRTFRKRLNACATTMGVPVFGDIRSIRTIEPSGVNIHGRPTELAIADRQRKIFHVPTQQFIRAANAAIPALPKPTPTIWSSSVVGKNIGSVLQLDGVGLGHGVGLCQYGAQVFAERGKTWEYMLSWYYPNATISTLPSA